MNYLIGLFLIIIQMKTAFSICVHEESVYGLSINNDLVGHETFVLNTENKFVPIGSISVIPFQKYLVQYIEKNDNKKNFKRYNKKYLEYYRYSHIVAFINRTKEQFKNLNYESVKVGESVLGRDLFSIRPKNFDPNKKTIVMFGRHHGDEGTANWIIEGFVKEFLNAGEGYHEDFQLVLYPMVNPDGAEAQSRYNENDRDLNRSWSMDTSKTYDEAKLIHSNLKAYLKNPKQVIISLDMHGSFTKDFIYRVEDDYVTRDFYNHQQQFIDQLGTYDIWQKGRSELSNGHHKMARIVLINGYGLNALTHETPRDIKIKNKPGRSKLSLKAQGSDIFHSLNDIY
jgi:hypothetical protein